MDCGRGTFLWALLALVVVLSGMDTSAFAHELQPGYLELSLVSENEYAVVWKVPAARGRPMAIAARLPANCTPDMPEHPIWDGSAYVARWNVTCPGGLEGGTIQIDGLAKTSTDVLVRFDYADGVNEARRLTPGNPSFVVPTQPNPLEVARAYLLLGVEHILSGFDHLLFVFALLLLVKGSRRILATVTAFTLAHSLTLAIATLGYVHVSGPPVEATIALSIVFIAAEIIQSRKGKPGLTERYPWVVAFTFGLLHGFGFAGALTELGLPQKSIPVALLLFNVGVELGQLFFIAALFTVAVLARHFTRRVEVPLPEWTWAVPPYAIGSVAMFWVIQRVVTFIR